MTLLELCAASKWEEVLKLKSFPPEQVHLSTKDEGWTPLHYACIEEQLAVVKRLLKEGADPSSGDSEGTTAVHIAATLPSVAMLRALFEGAAVKVNPDQGDRNGSTALHLAADVVEKDAIAEAAECIAVLLERGASASAKDKSGKTPLDLAKHDEIRDALAGTKLSARVARRLAGKKGGASDDASADAVAGPTTAPASAPSAEPPSTPRGSLKRGSKRTQAQTSRLEQMLIEELEADDAAGGITFDLALELLPPEHAKDARRRAAASTKKKGGEGAGAEQDPEEAIAYDVASGDATLTRTALLQRVRAPSVGLETRLVWHPTAENVAFLLVGASLPRLAREAERIDWPMQLRPGLEERLHLEREQQHGGQDEAAAEAVAAELEALEALDGRDTAYAPYRRRAPQAVGGAELSLSTLERSRVVQQVFALHDMRERRALEERWSASASLGLAPAPLTELYNYFGAEYALYFAFLRRFSQWLWAPAALGLVLFVFNETEYAGQESVWQALYCLLIVLWASAFLQHWTRTQAGLCHQWAINDGHGPHAAASDPTATAGEAPAAEREEFVAANHAVGFYTSNDDFVALDAEVVPDGVPLPLVGVFGRRERLRRLMLSWAVLVAFVAAAVCAQLGLLLGRSLLITRGPSAWWSGQILGSLFTAVVVELFDAVLRPLVDALLAWQNHRSAARHEVHFAQQLFFAAFCNRFFSPLYLTLLKPLSLHYLFHSADTPGAVLEVCYDRDGSPSDSCAEELTTLVGALVIVNCVVQNGIEYASATRALSRLQRTPGGRVTHEASMGSAQSAGGEFSELIMSYAMVALFGGAFLPAAAFALINNALEARLDSHAFLRCQQRPRMQLSHLMATWRPVLQLISLLAIVTNTVLVCHAFTTLPMLFGARGGHEYAMGMVIEHVLLALKLLLDLSLADAEEEAEEDDEPVDEPHKEEKLSELGLLRSFMPGPNEENGGAGARDIARKLQEASQPLPDTRGASPAEVERIAKQQRKQLKQRRKLVLQLGWTPRRALARASSSLGFTDVICLLPMLMLWLVMIAIGILGGQYGNPERLFFGIDYERNTCGSTNAYSYPLRYDTTRSETFPYAIRLPNARFSSVLDDATQAQLRARQLRTGERNLAGSKNWWYSPASDSHWLLAYADPATRLGVCVAACPRPRQLGSEQLCTYDASPVAVGGTGATASASRRCYPAYASVAMHGYCVPTTPAPQAAYHAAGVNISASELNALRTSLLHEDGRYFDAIFGDVVLVWQLLLGCPIVAAVLAFAWAYGSVIQPAALYGLAVLICVVSSSGLTYVFWSGGERFAEDVAASDLGASAQDDGLWIGRNRAWLENTGYVLVACTAALPIASVLLGRLCLPSLPLLQVAGPLLLGTPAAMVGPALCVIAQLLFAALWVWGAAYLASSGMVELTHAEGYARPTFDSGVKLLLIVWALGGIWTFAFIRHLGLLAAAGPLARGYWLSAELRAQLPAPPLYVRLLGPWVRVGSAAVGATLHCSGASALVAVLQSFGVHRLDALDEAGYVSVALFGTGYVEGSRWATSITSRFVPRLLMMQARCGLYLSFCKLACAMGATAVAAAFLAGHEDYARPSAFAAEAGIASIVMPLFVIFGFTFQIVSTVLSPVQLMLSAAVQSWCLDYQQNVVEQQLGGATWMMGASDPEGSLSLLMELHELLLDELAQAASEREQQQRELAQRAAAAARRAARDAEGIVAPTRKRADQKVDPGTVVAEEVNPGNAVARPAASAPISIEKDEDEDEYADVELTAADGGDVEEARDLSAVMPVESSNRRRRPPKA
ncbi:d chain transport protein [Chrysochromulina tobinii]|uniref:D chain transport protein n=1 Tax=Chrysochromulina tobinii TaxID=1460289 RepID=A0A0M0KAY6_9EUKA|nr:d chain transport protein [Chrysochromulina tobinii]|eukprot:KOO35990.1 d chain transport protein [Chrysochromulina sp. CCMP291]